MARLVNLPRCISNPITQSIRNNLPQYFLAAIAGYSLDYVGIFFAYSDGYGHHWGIAQTFEIVRRDRLSVSHFSAPLICFLTSPI